MQPGGSAVKKLPANTGDAGSTPGWGRFHEGKNINPCQGSCLGNPMDRGDWRATVHGVTRVRHDWAPERQNCRHRPQGVHPPEMLALPWTAVNKEEQTHWRVDEWDIPGNQRGECIGSEAPRQGQGIGHLCFVGSPQEKNKDRVPLTGNNLVSTGAFWWMVFPSRTWDSLGETDIRHSRKGGWDGNKAGTKVKPHHRLSWFSRLTKHQHAWHEVLVAQPCLTLCNSLDCSPPGSPVHGILQARTQGVTILLQGILPTQGLNPGILHCRHILHCLSHEGSPKPPEVHSICDGKSPKAWSRGERCFAFLNNFGKSTITQNVDSIKAMQCECVKAISGDPRLNPCHWIEPYQDIHWT